MGACKKKEMKMQLTRLLGGERHPGHDGRRADDARRNGVYEGARARFGVFRGARDVGLGLDREDVGLAGGVLSGVAEALMKRKREKKMVEREREGQRRSSAPNSPPPAPRTAPPSSPPPRKGPPVSVLTDRELDVKSRPSFLGSARATKAARRGAAPERAAGARRGVED